MSVLRQGAGDAVEVPRRISRGALALIAAALGLARRQYPGERGGGVRGSAALTSASPSSRCDRAYDKALQIHHTRGVDAQNCAQLAPSRTGQGPGGESNGVRARFGRYFSRVRVVSLVEPHRQHAAIWADGTKDHSIRGTEIRRHRMPTVVGTEARKSCAEPCGRRDSVCGNGQQAAMLLIVCLVCRELSSELLAPKPKSMARSNKTRTGCSGRNASSAEDPPICGRQAYTAPGSPPLGGRNCSVAYRISSETGFAARVTGAFILPGRLGQPSEKDTRLQAPPI